MEKHWFFVVALGLAACGGDGGADGGATDGGTDAGGGVAVDVVFAARDAADDSPLAGVTFAVDRPDGTRVEAVTDATGRVTFSVDWSAGPIDATAHLTGYEIMSGVGLTAELVARFQVDGAWPIPMRSNAPRTDLVTLSGRVLGGSNPGHNYQVTSSARGATYYNATGLDYTMEVPPGEAMRLTALEYSYASRGVNDLTQTLVAAATVEMDAIAADTTLDLDLTAMPHTFMAVSGTATALGVGTPLAGAMFRALIWDRETSEFYGAVTSLTPDGADVDYTLGFFQPSYAVAPHVRYSLQRAPLYSEIIVDGWPAGPVALDFLAPPEVVVPAFGVPHPLHDPFTIGRVAAGVETGLVLFDLNQEDRRLWSILSPGGGETLTIPELPSSASAAEVFPTGADVYAVPLLCEREGANELCTRSAAGPRAVDLMP